jgi:membrane protease YdiL (CAAX protease family)
VFSLRLLLTIAVAAVLAAIVAPWVAFVVGAIGLHFPFPRIFDRVVMVTTAVAMWYQAGALGLLPRLRAGFAQPKQKWPAAAVGIMVAAVAMALLLGCAFATASMSWTLPADTLHVAARYLLPAVIIGVVEEAFFRAVLLDGMTQDFGPRPALVLSAAVYAFAHQVRSPARFHLDTLHPLAGFATLGASLERMGWLRETGPAIFGLFLLGLLLGAAFLATRTVYFSIGLHAGVVIGSKMWRQLIPGVQRLPGWLFGHSGPPPIGGVAAWAVIFLLLVLIGPLTKPWRPPAPRRKPA